MTKTALAPFRFAVRPLSCLAALALAGCAAPRDPAGDPAAMDGSSTGGTTSEDDADQPGDDRGADDGGPANDEDDGTPGDDDGDPDGGSSTGGNAMDDAADADDTGSTGEAIACDDAGGFCAKTVPFGWEGPVTMLSWADEDEAPDCAGAYDIPVAASLSHNLIAPPADCTCECGDAVGTTCVGEITVQESPNGTCAFNVGDEIVSLDPNEAGPIDALGPSGLRFVLEEAPHYPGGLCEMTEYSEIADAHFGDHLTLCAAAEVAGACEGSETCMPQHDEAVDGPMCIWKEGEVECPAAPDVSMQYYTERTVVYSDFNDTRGCSECHCENQPGSCTDGIMQFSQALLPPATFPANPTAAAIDACLPILSNQNLIVNGAWTGVAPIGAECEKTGGNDVGEANGIDPITVCCYTP